MVFGALDLGIAILIAFALAEYTKITRRSEKGWTWFAVAGVFLIFAGLPALGGAAIAGVDLSAVQTIFAVIGWILALVGTVFIAYETLTEK